MGHPNADRDSKAAEKKRLTKPLTRSPSLFQGFDNRRIAEQFIELKRKLLDGTLAVVAFEAGTGDELDPGDAVGAQQQVRSLLAQFLEKVRAAIP